MRHPLARALHGIGMDTTDVAARLEVDPKTVARWIDGRVPYPRHRAALVQLTGWTERDLWPAAASPESTDAISEVLVTYPHRSSVPADVWRRLFFGRAHAEIGVLAYSALFLAEDAGVLSLLRQKIEAGTVYVSCWATRTAPWLLREARRRASEPHGGPHPQRPPPLSPPGDGPSSRSTTA